MITTRSGAAQTLRKSNAARPFQDALALRRENHRKEKAGLLGAARRSQVMHAVQAVIQPEPQSPEFQSELDLALSVRDVRTFRSDLTESAIAGVVIRSIKDRSVEGVEVVDLENALESLAHVEVLARVQVLTVVRSISQSRVVALSVADHILR